MVDSKTRNVACCHHCGRPASEIYKFTYFCDLCLQKAFLKTEEPEGEVTCYKCGVRFQSLGHMAADVMRGHTCFHMRVPG